MWGGYGGGNVGDELTLAVAIRDSVQRHGRRNVAVLTPTPDYTAFLFPGVRAIECRPRPVTPRWFVQSREALLRRLGRRASFLHYRPSGQIDERGEPDEWVRVLRAAEELYLVGGGYFSDHFNVEYLLLPVHLANCHGLEVSTAPLGLGPFWRAESEARIARELEGARLVVRDADSLDICRKLGLHAVLSPDDGFRCGEIVDIPRSGGGSGPRIGINVTCQTGRARDFEGWWAEVVRLVASWPGVDLSGFSFHINPFLDHLATSRVFRRAGLDRARILTPDLNFRTNCEAMGKFDGVIASRFHAVVTANLLGLSTIAVASGTYYTSKMRAAVSGAEGMAVADPACMSPAEASQCLRSMLDGGRTGGAVQR